MLRMLSTFRFEPRSGLRSETAVESRTRFHSEVMRASAERSDTGSEVRFRYSRGMPLTGLRSETPRASATSSHFRGIPRSGARSLTRSEEHTSELQSLTNLVCRLLLEQQNSSRL